MAAVLYWSGVGVAALLGAVLLLLAVPLDVRASIVSEAALSWSVQIRGLFGLLRFERGSTSRRSAERKAAEHAAAEAEPAGTRRRQRGVPRLFTDAAVWRRALRLLRASLRGLTLRRVDAQLRFGLEDPADTGRLYGMLVPGLMLLDSRMPGRVAVAPDFEHAGLAGRAAGELRIVPLRVLAPVASFGVWLGLHTWRKR